MEKSRVLNVKIMGDDEAKKKNVDTKDKVSYGFVHVYIYSITCYGSKILFLYLLKVPFVFTGLKSSVDNAKLMLEYHMEHLKVQILC